MRDYQVRDDPKGGLYWQPTGLNGWVADMLGKKLADPPYITYTEGEMLDERGPLDLNAFNDIKNRAASTASERYPPGPEQPIGNHDQTDAFRHAYWNALLVKQFGSDWAQKYTTAHEALPNNPPTIDGPSGERTVSATGGEAIASIRLADDDNDAFYRVTAESPCVSGAVDGLTDAP